MSWTFVSRFKVKADREAEFLTLIPQMERNAAEEPGTLAYKFYRLDAPHAFAVFESFVDEAADLAHQANPASTDIIKPAKSFLMGIALHDRSTRRQAQFGNSIPPSCAYFPAFHLPACGFRN